MLFLFILGYSTTYNYKLLINILRYVNLDYSTLGIFGYSKLFHLPPYVILGYFLLFYPEPFLVILHYSTLYYFRLLYFRLVSIILNYSTLCYSRLFYPILLLPKFCNM